MNTFASLDLFAPLSRALAEQNYVTPTPIQSQTIPAAIEGKDILGCAQTGTGKTAAFALPILDYIGQDRPATVPGRPLALILAPTRELAVQIGESFMVYGKHMKFRQALVYGGVGQGNQVEQLRKGVHVLIATPGRLLDLMQQKHVDLSEIEFFVLDEADRMLDMGFAPALNQIISKLPKERQSLFFSATMSPKIRQLAGSLLFNPVSVNVTPKVSSVERIQQFVRLINRSQKVDAISDLLSGKDVERAIVFTRTKRGANVLSQKLEKAGHKSVAIHGNKTQNARQRALDAFRKQDVTVLVATDVAARGIDIDGVTHVVNYDMPVEPESYVHRIGRTGRAGADGIAITFCTADERSELRDIEKLIGQKIVVENPSFVFDASDVEPASARRFQGGRGQGRSGGRSRVTQSATTTGAGSTAGRGKPGAATKVKTKFAGHRGSSQR